MVIASLSINVENRSSFIVQFFPPSKVLEPEVIKLASSRRRHPQVQHGRWICQGCELASTRRAWPWQIHRPCYWFLTTRHRDKLCGKSSHIHRRHWCRDALQNPQIRWGKIIVVAQSVFHSEVRILKNEIFLPSPMHFRRCSVVQGLVWPFMVVKLKILLESLVRLPNRTKIV